MIFLLKIEFNSSPISTFFVEATAYNQMKLLICEKTEPYRKVSMCKHIQTWSFPLSIFFLLLTDFSDTKLKKKFNLQWKSLFFSMFCCCCCSLIYFFEQQIHIDPSAMTQMWNIKCSFCHSASFMYLIDASYCCLIVPTRKKNLIRHTNECRSSSITQSLWHLSFYTSSKRIHVLAAFCMCIFCCLKLFTM